MSTVWANVIHSVRVMLGKLIACTSAIDSHGMDLAPLQMDRPHFPAQQPHNIKQPNARATISIQSLRIRLVAEKIAIHFRKFSRLTHRHSFGNDFSAHGSFHNHNHDINHNKSTQIFHTQIIRTTSIKGIMDEFCFTTCSLDHSSERKNSIKFIPWQSEMISALKMETIRTFNNLSTRKP